MRLHGWHFHPSLGIIRYSYHYLHHHRPAVFPSLFFFNDTAPTELYTLSLHDALPILPQRILRQGALGYVHARQPVQDGGQDRKSTRLNSSHEWMSYAVFCVKKKKSNDASLWWVAGESWIERATVGAIAS